MCSSIYVYVVGTVVSVVSLYSWELSVIYVYSLMCVHTLYSLQLRAW